MQEVTMSAPLKDFARIVRLLVRGLRLTRDPLRGLCLALCLSPLLNAAGVAILLALRIYTQPVVLALVTLELALLARFVVPDWLERRSP